MPTDPFDKTVVISFLRSINETLYTNDSLTCIGTRILQHSFPTARCGFGVWSGQAEYPDKPTLEISAPRWFYEVYRFTSGGKHSHEIADFIEALPT